MSGTMHSMHQASLINSCVYLLLGLWAFVYTLFFYELLIIYFFVCIWGAMKLTIENVLTIS